MQAAARWFVMVFWMALGMTVVSGVSAQSALAETRLDELQRRYAEAGGVPQEYGLFLFNRYEPRVLRIECTLMQELLAAVHDGERLPLSAFMRRVEARLELPSNSLVRVPANARHRG